MDLINRKHAREILDFNFGWAPKKIVVPDQPKLSDWESRKGKDSVKRVVAKHTAMDALDADPG